MQVEKFVQELVFLDMTRCRFNFKKGATNQKINTETNIDRTLTKITRHGLYPSQIQVWTFLGPNPAPIMVKIDYVC